MQAAMAFAAEGALLASYFDSSLDLLDG